MGRKFSGWTFGGLNFGAGIFWGDLFEALWILGFFDFYGVRSPPKFMV